MNKYYKKYISVFAPIVANLHLDLLTKPFFSGKGNILIFHRVVPKDNRTRIHNHDLMEISPELLEKTIHFFKKRNYKFLHIDEIQDFLIKSKSKEKFVVFTFDDGYLDNYTYAFPMFKSYEVPFTIFITTNMPEGKAILWSYMLEDFVLNNDELNIDLGNGIEYFDIGKQSSKELFFYKIRSLFVSSNQFGLKELISKLFNYGEYQIKKYLAEHSLDWKKIIELNNNPLVTIGSHTINHRRISKLNDEMAKYEIFESKLILESKIGSKVEHFSYPFGDYSNRDFELLKEACYKSGTTTKMTNLFLNGTTNIYAYPRLPVYRFTSNEVMKLQINGFLPFLKYGFKQKIV
jgi:peptidoglycan/xylan/chitin deacetylase (PgdA/CDA1 family)